MLAFSPKLHTILNFDAIPRTVPIVTPPRQEFVYRFDHTVFSDDLSGLITREMEVPSIERASNIVTIMLTSSNLLTEGEFNDDETVSHTITSFNPVFSQPPGILEYNLTGGGHPHRAYKMLSSSEMHALDLGVSVLYSDGATVQHQLAPWERFFATLMFHPSK